MPKDKERRSNPVQSFNKKLKKDTINKAKHEKAKLRDTQLQKRRPDQVQRQIDELRELERSGTISANDRRHLETLERDLARIEKLRAEGKLGPIVISERTKGLEEKQERQRTKRPKHPEKSYYYDALYNPTGVPPPGMPYRERDEGDKDEHDSDTSTTSSVARIPMPEGTPPPLSDDDSADESEQVVHSSGREWNGKGKKAPGRMASGDKQGDEGIPKVVAPSQTSYSSEPVLKDLRREAVQFVPKSLKRAVVAQPLAHKPIDPLDPEVEPEEWKTKRTSDPLDSPQQSNQITRKRLNAAPSVP